MNSLDPLQPGVEAQPRPVSFRLPMHRPIVTWVLLGLVGIAFVVEMLAGGSTDAEVLVRLGAKYTPLIAMGEYWRLLTAMFLHVGFTHLLFNGYALVAVGSDLEQLFGAGRFLAVYLLSGLFGSLASYAFSPYRSAGASGAIFGVIGALGLFFLLHREQLGRWGRARLGNIGFLVVINLVLGFTVPGIDNLGHIGGLVSGAAVGWALAPRYQVDYASMQLQDRNRVGRYWPALVVAVLVLVAGTAAATAVYRANPRLLF